MKKRSNTGIKPWRYDTIQKISAFLAVVFCFTILLQLQLVCAEDAKESKFESSKKVSEDGNVLEGHSFHGEAFNEGPRQKAYLMGGTANVTFNVSTDDALAQQFFNQGIGQLHGFWYFEAERSFRQVAMLDPECAMAYGGMAMANFENEKRAIGFIKEAVKRKKSIDLSNLIKKYNFKYEILKINKGLNFELKQSNLRSYHFKNIIAFGDILHRIHPLAGQGFNMTIRDIKEIYRLIKFKKIHGLSLDKSIGNDFEKNSKDKNYIFSSGIDFIYEFFNLESKFNTNNLSKFVKFFGKNKTVNKFFTTFADNGITLRDY